MSSLQVKIEGMHCVSCAKLIEMKVRDNIPDITSVNIDVESGRAEFESKKEISKEDLKTALAGTEYSIN